MLRIHDHVATLIRKWADVPATTDAATLRRVRRAFEASFPAYYVHRFDLWRTAGLDVDTAFASALRDESPALVERMHTVHARLSRSLPAALAEFETAFADFAGGIDVHLVHSLGELNGGVRVLDGESVFLLGVDMIARHHTTDDDTAFLHHELFHVHHLRVFDPAADPDHPEDEILIALWMEGLATHVSAVLNPSAGPAELFLDFPPGQWVRYEAARPELAAEMLRDLRRTDRDAYARWFLPEQPHDGTPARSGYYLGYLVAQALGATRSLRELTRLPVAAFAPLVERELRVLADRGGQPDAPA